ncbi:unnamed protein product, partial [Rotaria magnacalcarata]
MEASNRTSKTT